MDTSSRGRWTVKVVPATSDDSTSMRQMVAFALSSAAVAMDVQAGRIMDARVALGGVGTRPWHAVDAEKALVGKTPGEDAYRAAAEAALRGAKPHKDNAFKIELAKRTIVRALATCEAMA